MEGYRYRADCGAGRGSRRNGEGEGTALEGERGGEERR